METSEETPTPNARFITIDFSRVERSIKDFKDRGFYTPKPSNRNGCGFIELGKVIPKAKLPTAARKLFEPRGESHGGDYSSQDEAFVCSMLNAGHTPQDTLATFLESPRGCDAAKRHKIEDYSQRTVAKAVAFVGRRSDGIEPADGSNWRKEFKSKNQLCRAAPRSIIQRLVPEKALTMITAPSFHGKSWIALHLGKAISAGKGLWGFDGPEHPVPFRYHVPEMDESMVRQRMEMLNISDSDMFLVRAMESGTVWPLDDERMLASAQGSVVCLDTTGYFNDADDTSSYQQAIRFGKSVFNLLTTGGARAVIGLYHPPKYSLKETTMTLENMLLGSAGYGGLLRSCLGVRNLNADPNEEDLWLYVQGLKNPRLKPFQLGGLPLSLKVKPGESPYLSAIAGTKRSNHKHEREQQVREMLARGDSVRSIAEKLRMSHNTIKGIRDESDSD